MHHNIFAVSETESKAKVKGLKTILNLQARHKDNQIEIETAVCLNQCANQKNLYVHLKKTDDVKPFDFTCKYLSISLEKLQR